MATPMNARVLQAIAAATPAPRPAPSTEAEWTSIDVATLSPSLRAAHDTYREASRAASALRAAFEAEMIRAIDPLDTEKVIFGYRFGKLSLAIVPADKPKRTVSAASLADFMGRTTRR